VPDEALHDIGELLGMSVADLDGIATFYNLIFRQPVGRHVIYLCDSVSCWIMGGDRQCRHASERLGVQSGETTADGRFTLLPIVCLGACDHAPVMMIDDDLHLDLTPEKIDQILGGYK
jgi:NADH-quinone oxidoreductase subunit E